MLILIYYLLLYIIVMITTIYILKWYILSKTEDQMKSKQANSCLSVLTNVDNIECFMQSFASTLICDSTKKIGLIVSKKTKYDSENNSPLRSSLCDNV